MKIKEFIDEYRRRKNERDIFRVICKENNISSKNLYPFFKNLGVEYVRASKEWQYVGDKESIVNEIDISFRVPARRSSTPAAQPARALSEVVVGASDNIKEYVQQQHSSSAADPDPDPKQLASIADMQHKNSISTLQQQLITDQLFDITDILQQINAKLPDQSQSPAAPFDPVLSDPAAAPLALQLHRISQSAKARKTVNISHESAQWLDRFTATKGYKIGDIVTLAVMQLKSRIDPPADK